MKIEIIGSGGAFDEMNTSFFFRDDMNRGVLVDCGTTIWPELMRRQMVSDIDVVLITHKHPDHVCGLGALVMKRGREKPIAIGGDDVSELLSMIGVNPTRWNQLPKDDLLNIKKIPVKHDEKLASNFGLFIAGEILYSGDTSESLLGTDFAKFAKIIFHETTIGNSDAHVSLDVLANASADIKAKTWLVHIPEHERQEITRLAAEMGFAGVCTNGQTIEI